MNLKSRSRDLGPGLRFSCRAEDFGVIADPVPAGRDLPEWFRTLPGVDRAEVSAANSGITAKRCLPLLEAFTIGWIIPLAATVRLSVSDHGKTVEAGWEFDRPMVSPHGMFQTAGHPHEPRPPMKFHNYWTVSTSPGWGCLFAPVLNRPNSIVDLVSGLVDTSIYRAPVNFPFHTIAEDGVHVIERGTPLVHVIPIRLAHVHSVARIEPEHIDERRQRTSIERSTKAGAGWYRKLAIAQRHREGGTIDT